MNFFFVYKTADGTIQGLPYATDTAQWTNVPDGCAVLGPIPESDSTAQAASQTPNEYTVQNEQLVHSNPPTAAEQLTSAQQSKIAEITAALNATLAGGFTSKATGHTYVTTINGEANMTGDLKRLELDSTLTSVQFYTIDTGWIAHTLTQLQGAFLDGGKWKDAQYSQAQNLIEQVKSATTVDAVNSVPPFTAATY